MAPGGCLGCDSVFGANVAGGSDDLNRPGNASSDHHRLVSAYKSVLVLLGGSAFAWLC